MGSSASARTVTNSRSRPSTSPPSALAALAAESSPSSQSGKERNDHAVARLPCRHFRADGDDFPCAVRERDARQLHARIVFALHDEQIAVIQRDGAESDHHLVRGRFRRDRSARFRFSEPNAWSSKSFMVEN